MIQIATRAPRALTRGLGAVLVLVGGACGPVDAQTPPRRMEDVPLFPGMTLVSETAPSQDEGEHTGRADPWTHEPLPMRRATVRTYRTTSSPEEVYSFYLARLGGIEAYDEEDVNPFMRDPGEATRVVRRRYVHSLEDDASHPEYVLRGETRRRTLAAARSAGSDGGWISDAGFDWAVREPGGDITDYMVGIVDEGLSDDWTRWTPHVTVTITILTHAGPEEAQ